MRSPTTRRGPGRPVGGSDARADILAAARSEFAERGYDGATIRGIAKRAGVDPALVHHHYGAKADVFVAAVDFPIKPAVVVERVMAGGQEQLGASIAAFFIGTYEDPAAREPVFAIVRAAMVQERAATMMREFLTRALVDHIAPRLSFAEPDARMRLELAVSHMVGLIIVRYVIRLEPLASMAADELVGRVGPVLQRYFDA